MQVVPLTCDVLANTADPLAYYTAKTNGLDDTALDILEEAGMTEDDLPAPPRNSGHSSLSPPKPVFSQVGNNWPIKNLGESFFDRALANGVDGSAGEPSSLANGAEQLDAWAADEPAIDEDEGEVDEDEGWDLDDEVIPEPEEEHVEAETAGGEADLSEGVSPGVAENEMWVRNSPLAADHAAAGDFESAMQASLSCVRGERRADHPLSCSTVKSRRSTLHR
jgi:coatomer protein complex subunit alpha (xenin)